MQNISIEQGIRQTSRRIVWPTSWKTMLFRAIPIDSVYLPIYLRRWSTKAKG